MTTLWHGRFDGPTDDRLRALSDSLSFDIRLYSVDIDASRAHVRMLGSVGLIQEAERDDLLSALDVVESEFNSGSFESSPDDEDVHTAVERRVTELTPAGEKLHTGRSRNDQVATDLRLWTRSAIDETVRGLIEFEQTIVARARETMDVPVPGYTHLQRAQPVSLGDHLLAHGWSVARDVDRLLDARKRVNISPLGAGALAGTTLPIDPSETAADLGFEMTFANSLDAVSDRDFVVETLAALATLGVHMSRLGEELVLWATTEFGFIELDDSYTTGSSMMPQKANPDVAELARGKSGRLIGNLTGLLATLKGLPLAYNKDLQEDKEPLFDSFDTVQLVIPALDGMVATARFDTKRMSEAAGSEYMRATDLAEWLVRRGIAFRNAHTIVARLVNESLTSGRTLRDLVAESTELGPDAASLLETSGLRTGGSMQHSDDQLAKFETVVADQTSRLPSAE